ncbi:MAG: lipid-A-disaccharide synthase-related protein [Armatimonadota bacterium]|nr:lipid-A-disaccharide synthase-related protein [Armatimonadota bacterium]MDR7404963.1 lipid-A-disaccharide synthase-related protein [Armatimonadota bacterium]
MNQETWWTRLTRLLILGTALVFSSGYAAAGLFLLLMAGVAESLATRRIPWERSPLDLPLAAFVAAFLLAGVASPYRGTATGSAVLSALVLWAGFAPFYRNLRGRPSLGVALVRAWVAGGLGAAVWTLASTPLTGRAELPALSVNPLGTTLMIACVLSLGLAMTSAGAVRLLAAATGATSVLALALTYSRGSWVGAAAGVVALLVMVRGRWVAPALVSLAAAAAVWVVLFPSAGPGIVQRAATIFNPAANEDRLALARAALAIFRDHPLVGTGMNTFWMVHPDYVVVDAIPRAFAHNIILNAAAEGGLVGLAALVAVIAGALAAGYRWRRAAATREERILAAAVLAAFVGLLVREQFDGTIMTVNVAAGFWMLVAVQAAFSQHRQPAPVSGEPAPLAGRPSVLVVSNGHGEDAVGMVLAQALRPAADVAAFPLVGLGTAYRDIPLLDPRRALPSGGFGFRNHLPGLLADLRAGVLRLWWQQRRTLRACRGRFDAVVAIGDFYCLWMAAHAGRPVVYIATAKSEHGEPHQWLELRLMRRLPAVVFARDALTASALAARGVPARHVGNPLMDTIGPDGTDPRLDPRLPTVLLLPGSRQEAYGNLELLLALAGRVGRTERVNLVCALAPSLDLDRVHATAVRAGWQADGDVLRSSEAAVRLTGAFGAAVRVADVVVGLAGTANEQAAGLGKPVVAFPGPGPQFTRPFLRLQQRILGDAVVAVGSWDEAAEAVLRLLGNPAERARRGEAGRQRMGPPGAVSQIAAEVLALLPRPAASSPSSS